MKFSMRLAAVAAAVLLVAGCSTITPKDVPENLPNTSAKAQEAMAASDGWDAEPVVTEGKTSIVIMTPFSIPAEVKARKVQLSLEPGATVKDVVAFLGELGVPILLSDPQAGGREFYLPRFNGTLGQLLSAISRGTDVWFTWNEGAILVSSTERIAVSVPQDKSFGEVLVKGLESYGIKEHAVTSQAGMASLDVTPSQFRRVRQYLARMTDNSAFITLQVAVVSVTLNQNAKQGIDWDKLQLSALKGGNPQDLQAWQKVLGTNQATNTGATAGTTTGAGYTNTSTNTSSNPLTGTTTTSTGAATDTTSTIAGAVGSAVKAVSQVGFAGGALQGLVFANRFNFSGMFNFLQTYGNVETKQNVLVKTVAGNKVEFKSLTQIPYVKEIGVTTSTSSGNNTALGSTQTEKADDGITVEMTPTYDAAANTVSVDMKLAIKAVVAFNELSAGNQLGKLTQPTTAERSFNDILRMRPGQTMVVGGLSYDSVSNNFGSPLFLQGTKAESQALKLDRQSMFLVVRSSVVRIGQLDEETLGSNSEDYLEFTTPKAPLAPAKRSGRVPTSTDAVK